MVRYIKICATCEKQFKTSRCHAKTCSSKCRGIFNVSYKHKPIVKRACENCGTIFDTNTPSKKYCCVKCRNAMRYRRESVNLLERIRKNLRCRVNEAIRGRTKRPSIVVLLGLSMSEFKVYLESKFQSGMTWENYGRGGWDVDHIVPLSKFDVSNPEQLKIACYYTNLQPLWHLPNLKKGSKIL